jgi:hypothetical protein
MRTYLTLALASVLGLAVVPVAVAHTTPAKAPVCVDDNLDYAVRTLTPVPDSIVYVKVSNDGDATCTIDHFPSVTFAGLDGSARPVPATESGARSIAADGWLFAALRTDDRSGAARNVRSVTVAANPAHSGRTFSAGDIGAPVTGIAVSDPITTLWFGTLDEALAALPASATN